MLNSINQNKNVDSSKKDQTESSLNHQTFDYNRNTLLIINDLTEILFKQGKPTTITKEMIDKKHAENFTEIEKKIHVKSEDIISYFGECIGHVNNKSANQYIYLAINYGSASKSIFVSIMNDLLLMTTCDEGFAKKILPSSSYFETTNSQTGNTSKTKLITFFENEKSKIKEMNNFDLLGFLNYIVGFNWRSNEQFDLNKRSELNN